MRIPFTAFCCLFMLFPWQFTQADEAVDFISFEEIVDADTDSDCNQRGGLRVYVLNRHPQRVIDLHIDRYFSTVRQAGRSMFALSPGGAQPLGCNRVLDAPQHWEVVRAEFIEADMARLRYGEILGMALPEPNKKSPSSDHD